MFSYLSKFYANIVTGSGVMTIYFIWNFTRNPEIENTLAWVLSSIWRLERVRNTKFDMIVSNEKSNMQYANFAKR